MKPNRIKRVIRHSIIAIAIGCALPAHAQVPTVDPAHIGMQLGQWAQQFIEWKKNLDQWTSTFQSQLRGTMDALVDTANAGNREADLDKIITQMQEGRLCDKVKVVESKLLCDQEQMLKVSRAKRIVKALKDSSASLNKINLLFAQYNALALAGTVSSIGGTSNTNEGKLDTIAKSIDTEQNKIQQIFEEAQKDIQIYDSQVAMVHGLRVDFARIQLEGQEPNPLDKIAVTAGVGATLKKAADGYKKDIESIKSTSKTNNNY